MNFLRKILFGGDRLKMESSDAPIFFFNTLSQKKEEFLPLRDGEVRMYNCGPTVYNYAHIGNLRSFILADILRRLFEFNGYRVKQVMNITDVGHLTSDADLGEDKIEMEAKKEKRGAKEISAFYTEVFFRDLHALNVPLTKIDFPKATDHIKEQIELIKKLEAKGATYKTSDGIYFDTSRFPEYGKLGKINLTGLEEGARIGVNQEKRNPTDFAVWKFSRPDEKREQEWPSPWGIGFPGWHIECSAMSMKYLGESFDVHTGGIDHIPIHHNNEIAQSECATGKPYARYWLHNAFVTIPKSGEEVSGTGNTVTNGGGEKMAKSEGNFIRLETLINRKIHPLSYRYWLLTAHYRQPIQFSFEAVLAAQNAYIKLIRSVAVLSRKKGKMPLDVGRKFLEIINNDLDTPNAISFIWRLLKESGISSGDLRASILELDKVLGLNIGHEAERLAAKVIEAPARVKERAHEREILRKEKNWAAADIIRNEIEGAGFVIEDTSEGPILLPREFF